MSQKPATIEDFKKILGRNLPIAILYICIFLTLPIFAFIDAIELFPYLSLLYQVIGIRLLFIDEKYKMHRKKKKYSKLNTFIWSILESPKKSIDAAKWIYKYKTNPPRSDCDMQVEIEITQIDHNYDKISDSEEKRKAQVISIESDLMMLRYFSEVRKAGYIFLTVGFILQFFAFVFD